VSDGVGDRRVEIERATELAHDLAINFALGDGQRLEIAKLGRRRWCGVSDLCRAREASAAVSEPGAIWHTR
jgi:hypothetical protein